MRKTLLTIGLGLALSSVTTFSSPAAGAGRVMLHGHVPAGLSGLQSKGLLPATTNLDLAIGLPLRNREALTNLLQQLYDPASPHYHHFLTPEEFTAQFGPTEQDYQAVIDFAKTNGLAVDRTHPNRMLLNVSGKTAAIEKALHVTLRTYQHPKEARDFFASDVEPSVPAGLAVQDISGLNNYSRPHPNYIRMPANVSPLSGSGPFGGYIGDDFRRAYVPGTSLNGSGQTVALVQFDGYFASDIATYETMAGRTNVPLQNVLLDGFSGAPGFANAEVCLDIEMVISMAPALAKVIVYEGFVPNNVLNRIATDNSARQISCSWGWTGGPNGTTDQIFQQMAIQGQSFFTASGDSDAYPTGTVDNPFGFGAPADSPYVTSVGGTTLTMTSAGGSRVSETVWNWGGGIGSSGGFSSYYSMPAWQTNINMTASQGSTTTRNFPDVALTADNVFVTFDGGSQGVFGGTSCAAPLWAGFTALVNQQATNNGHTAVGFLNPAVYAIAGGANYNACFHDIRTGNNTWSGSPTLFYAVSNYDLCTGLGTPRGTNLINALTAVGAGSNSFTHISPPPPPYGSTLAAVNGGNPNGKWELFVLDDAPFDAGMISNGWMLTLTMASPVGQAGDLAISMTNLPSNSVMVSNNLVYFIGVTNYGPSTSSNVMVVDTLPLSVTLMTNSQPGSVTLSGVNVIWNVGTLASGVSTNLTLTVRPNSPGTILNYAIVSSLATPDFNPADDFASVTNNVGAAQPPLLSGSFVSTNGTFQFTITSGANQTNVIQASTNFVNWISIFTNVGSFTFTNAIDPNYPFRFYRDYILGP